MEPEAPLLRVLAVLVLPYVLLYAWWVGRKEKRQSK